MHKLKIALLLVLTASLMVGCGKSTIKTTTISLHKDGSVKHTIIEDFDTTSEDGVEDLKQMVLKEIASYNTGASDGKISITKVEAADDNKVLVEMSYPDMTAFHDFNNADADQDAVAFFGTVQEAYDAGYDLSGVTVYENGDQSSALTGDDILAMGDQHIFIYDNALNSGEPVVFQSYEKINYCSKNATIDNKKATIDSEAGNMVYLIMK